MKEFLNYDKLYSNITGLLKEVAKSYDTDYSDECESYADELARRTVDDMKIYVHKKDTKIVGNFCDIRYDWEHPGFIPSEIEPWGSFTDVVKSIDDNTITDEELTKFQQWASDWFFYAFGTYNLRYNFGSYLSELEYEKETA